MCQETVVLSNYSMSFVILVQLPQIAILNYVEMGLLQGACSNLLDNGHTDFYLTLPLLPGFSLALFLFDLM